MTTCQVSNAPLSCWAPQANVAANGTQIAQITTNNLNIYDYSGNLLKSTPIGALVAQAGFPAGNGAFESHIIYDEFVGRWVITTTYGYAVLLVSATLDARGTWSGIYIDNTNTDPAMHLGYDKNGIYVVEDQGSGTNPDAILGGYDGTLFAIPSSELAWTTSFNPQNMNRIPGMPLDTQPAVDQNPSKAKTAPAFFVAKSCVNNCQNATNLSFKWVVNSLTWSGATATYSSDQLVATAPGSVSNQWLYNTPIAAVSQLGSATVQFRPIESHRVENVVQNGSHLYAVLASGPCVSNCGNQGVDSNNLFFWVDLDCTTTQSCVVHQTGKLSDPSDHLEFPSIGVASNGNIAIAAESVGASSYLSVVSWTRKAADPLGTLSSAAAAASGTQPLTCVSSPLTIGTAVGISMVRDPADSTKLWTTQEYADSAAPCTWGTRILEFAP